MVVGEHHLLHGIYVSLFFRYTLNFETRII
uniref:Uncharacterized protein n=1 Tax=Arundo donax TaxID=35708 RepID=A0A0A9FYL8_ARUDO